MTRRAPCTVSSNRVKSTTPTNISTLHAAETIWVYDDDEGEESSDEEDEECDGSTTMKAPEDVEVVDDDGASDWEDEESDTETVTARNIRSRSFR